MVNILANEQLSVAVVELITTLQCKGNQTILKQMVLAKFQ
jgi:hypothetical protein